MKRVLLLATLLTVVCPLGVRAQSDGRTRSFDSPNRRFTLRASLPDAEAEEAKLDIIDNESGKIVGDLGTDYARILEDATVVWSADSTRLAYRTAGQKDWSTSVYFWNGSAFENVPLPANLSFPEIKMRKRDLGQGSKGYGGGQEPVRWLKSGDLELRAETTVMSRKTAATYTGSIVITIHFDEQHHASVKSVSKTATRID